MTQVALVLIVTIIGIALNAFALSENNFDLLVNVSREHFYLNQETYLVDNSGYRHFKEMSRVFCEHWHSVVTADGNATLQFRRIPRREKNVLFVRLDNNVVFWPLHPRDKVIFYVDLRGYLSACSGGNYLRFIAKHLFWKSLFQAIILFHYSSQCPKEFEIWTREPWSQQPGQRVDAVGDAYFNRKPNMHGAALKFSSTMEEASTRGAGSHLELLRNTWFEKWNLVASNQIVPLESRVYIEPADPPYSDAYSSIAMCFVVQKGRPRPKWESIARCFEWRVWLSLTLLWFLSGLAWSFIFTRTSLFKSWCDICSLMISQPISWRSNLRGNLPRLIAGLFMLTSIVTSIGFQSMLFKNLKVPRLQPPITQIRQIKEANLTIVCTFTYTCLVLFGSQYQDELFAEMFKLKQYVPPRNRFMQTEFSPNVTLHDVLSHRQMALITPCASARAMVTKIPKFSKKLHVVEEQIATYPLYYLPFPFESHLRRLLFWYMESGVGEWAQETRQWRNLMKILLKEENEPHVRVFSMDDVQIAFLILLVGLVAAIFVFIVECSIQNWLCRFESRKKPKRNGILFLSYLRRKYSQPETDPTSQIH